MRCLEGSFMGLGGFEWLAEMRLMLCILDFMFFVGTFLLDLEGFEWLMGKGGGASKKPQFFRRPISEL